MSVQTFESYASYKRLVRNEASPATPIMAALFDNAFGLSGAAHASQAPLRTPRPQTPLLRRGTPEFKKYEEFQNRSLATLLCYLSGYTALCVARRMARWPGVVT